MSLRSAIEVGFHELREQPWLFDYVFAWLINDELTEKNYGRGEMEVCRKWFLANNVDVIPVQLLNASYKQCVTVAVQGDVESRNKLDDRHYDTKDYQGEWSDLSKPFVPVAYDAAGGYLKLPQATVEEVYVVRGQLLVDRLGRSVPVLEKLSADELRIPTNASLEISGLVVRGKYPPRAVTLRSAYFDESFQVGCHTKDAGQTIWLYLITKFTLLRVRRRLLEARGLENSALSGSDFRITEFGDSNSQPGMSRYLTVRGEALNVWPDDVASVVESIAFFWTFSPRGSTEETVFSEP